MHSAWSVLMIVCVRLYVSAQKSNYNYVNLIHVASCQNLFIQFFIFVYECLQYGYEILVRLCIRYNVD